MRINAEGLELIKHFEKCELTVYLDAVGIPTVGWGHVTQFPVGAKISQELADKLLAGDLNKFEEGVDAFVKVPIEGNAFSALVCFAFNVGLGNLQHSTLLKKVNDSDFNGAADEFLKWDRAGGKVLPGLTKRRQAERALFLKPS